MDHGNDSQPQPSILPVLFLRLQELLALQQKYQPNVMLPAEVFIRNPYENTVNRIEISNTSIGFQDNGSEVTLGIRDGSAHILRCLKVWYDLPSDVLFVSVNIMDRFLTKMKVGSSVCPVDTVKFELN